VYFLLFDTVPPASKDLNAFFVKGGGDIFKNLSNYHGYYQKILRQQEQFSRNHYFKA